MFTHHLSRFGLRPLLLSPLSIPPDSGGGGAMGSSGAPSSGDAGGGPAGSGSAAASAAGNGQQSTAPSSWSEDAQYRLPDGRIVSGRDLIGEHTARISNDFQTRYRQGYDMLLAEARRLDGLRTNSGNRPPAAPQSDPLSELEAMGVPDGKTVAQLLRQLDQNGNPIRTAVSQLVAQVNELRGALGNVNQRFGSQDEQVASQQFQSRLDNVLGSIEVKGLNGPLDVKNPALRAFAENLYLSYVPSSWKAGEFEKMLGEAVNGMFEYFQAAQRQSVETARANVRRHFNSARGAGSPSGQPAYRFESPRELAARAREAGMFGGATT